MLVPMRPILEAADTYRYGQGAFNMNSAGQIEAAVRIHEILESGAILQGAEASNAYMGGAEDFMHGTLEQKQRGARAIGGAVGRNPISILIPCHRVVGSDGSLTGYAGGLEAKRFLLALEAK